MVCLMIELYIDGSCSPMNPGGKGVAGALFCHNGIIDARSKHLGSGSKMSNNVAEYEGLLLGLEICKERGITSHIHIYSDSMLVVKQMGNRWKVKPGKIYTATYYRVKAFYDKYFQSDKIVWEWIAGTDNPADGLTRYPYEVGSKNQWA